VAVVAMIVPVANKGTKMEVANSGITQTEDEVIFII
jgi:hypothetical protein